MIKLINLGKGYARFRWVSLFNSMKYKDEENTLNRKFDLYKRYIFLTSELSIAKHVVVVAGGVNFGYRNNDELGKEQFFKNANEKFKEIRTLQKELFKQLTTEYLNDELQFNTLDISPQMMSGILERLGISD